MIKVVHLSSNPISGSPYELNKLLNLYSTNIQSRLIQGTANYRSDIDIPERSFPYDLLWNENKDECIKLIQDADILHIHNSIFPQDLKEYIRPSQVVVLQLYSVYRDKLEPLLNKTMELNPIVTIADQPWQKQVYADLSNIYLPLVKTNFCDISTNQNPIIVYAPTNKLPLSHPYSKGYYEVLEILYRLKQKFNFELRLLESIPYEENLKQKQNADIIIDDIINENAYHGTSLEAACYGAIALTNYSGIDYPFKKTTLKTLEETLLRYLHKPNILSYDKTKLKEWQKLNYTPEILNQKYESFYLSLCTQKSEIENIENPREQSERMEKSKTFLFQTMCDWLQQNNIPFFLSFGSALKAYRDNEHALDADFGILSEYKWQVRKLIQEQLPSDIEINCIWRGEITFKLKNSKYPKLDFIFFDKQSDFYRCNIYSRSPFDSLITWERGIKISHKALEEFKEIYFKERKVLIPKNTELYLTENYTEEWKTPIPNKSYGWGSRPCADYDHRQIAIIIPTFLRTNKVKDCINSILTVYPKGMVRIYVGDQSEFISDEMNNFYSELEQKGHKFFRLPYNCGLSYSRNYLIQQTTSEPYILIIDDDFIFTPHTNLSKFIDVLEEKEDHGICGGNLEGRHHYAGWLTHHPSIQKIFKTDIFYVPQNINLTTEYNYRQRKVSYYYSDIVLNFFLAKKEVFSDCQWDNDLPLVEHTDYYLRLKQTKWKVCYAPEVTIQHSKLENTEEYKNFRHEENKKIGTERFCKKWNINSLNDVYKIPSKIQTPLQIPNKPIVNQAINEFNDVFREFIECLDKEHIEYCLLNETCRYATKHRNLHKAITSYYLGASISNQIKKTFQSMNYTINDNTFIKNNVKINVVALPNNTKKLSIGNKVFRVPYPLIRYLIKEFGPDWEKK